MEVLWRFTSCIRVYTSDYCKVTSMDLEFFVLLDLNAESLIMFFVRQTLLSTD